MKKYAQEHLNRLQNQDYEARSCSSLDHHCFPTSLELNADTLFHRNQKRTTEMQYDRGLTEVKYIPHSRQSTRNATEGTPASEKPLYHLVLERVKNFTCAGFMPGIKNIVLLPPTTLDRPLVPVVFYNMSGASPIVAIATYRITY